MTIDQSIDFGSTAAAFAGGCILLTFTVEFEPGATTLEKEGKGHVVASLGTDSGYVPYTALQRKEQVIIERKSGGHPEIYKCTCKKVWIMCRAHTPEEIAQVIAPQFKETTS